MNDQPRLGLRHGMSARQEFLASWKSARDGSAGLPNDLGIYPYPGLRSFRPNEADLFFGRDSQINELRDLLADHNIIVVLGGSGSGKSSLVRAGLVPKLNSTTPISERPGAWYVVEFRPKLDPVNEMFDAIFNQVILPALTVPPLSDDGATPDGSHASDFDKERARRIAAINSAFDLACAPDAPNESIQWQCRTRLRDVLFEGDVIDVGALFDFVDERLRMLDEALSEGASSGAPNLLLLIDQFEEIFKPKVDPAGCRMIMSLITSIHTYRPFNLFLIITMRSEELHRCSEFLGVTEVVNSSMYLVDLIGGRDIEQAIVEPARRVLKSWGLDPGDAETGPYTRRALSQLHQVFDDGREVLPHPADQLPLMQHMLPLIWDKAIERWAAKVDDATLQIDLEDFEALPGWRSLELPLIGTLNERANDVLRRAIASGSRVSGGELSEESAGRLLRAAFCCLAQLDDRGNVVRDFATLEQMLMASGVYERQPKAREACKGALKAALGVFQRATLVNVGTNYDVNHEALIRGWKTYADWLKDARRRIDRLVTVDHVIDDGGAPDQTGAWARLWMRLTPLSAELERCARASQIAGAETSADLQDVLGPNGAFSDHWARQTLERSDGASPNPHANIRSLDQRLSAVRQTVRDAIRYPEVKTRQLYLRSGYAVGAMGLLALIAVLVSRSIAQGDLNEQFRFFRLQSEATSLAPGVARAATQDRELFVTLSWALDRAMGRASSTDEATSVYRTSLRQLDAGARNVLAGRSVLRNFATSARELAGLKPLPAHCGIADPDQESKQLISKEPNSLGLELVSQDAGSVKSSAIFPIWRAPDGRTRQVQSSNWAGQTVLSGALLCLSEDGNWLLMWPPQPERTRSSAPQNSFVPPVLQRITWVRTGPTSEVDERWHADLGPSREPGTSNSYDELYDNDDGLDLQYQHLLQSVREGRRVFHYFRSGDRVGFLIDMAPDRKSVFWTTTGLLDPDTAAPTVDLVPCDFSPDPKADERSNSVEYSCEMGPIGFDNLNHRLVAKYQIVRPKTQSKAQLAGSPVVGPYSCEQQQALCRTELQILYDPPVKDRAPQRVLFSHISSTIRAAAISESDGSLWVRDANGQTWRYTVGLSAIRALVPERWKGVPTDRLGAHSEACTQAKCDKMLVPEWPSGGLQETGK